MRGSLTRAAVVLRLSERLRRHGWPRLQMSIMVALTGCAGWLLSAALLHLGVHPMVLRWPLAMLGAWAVFLGLLWLWIRVQRDGLGGLGDALADQIVSSDGDSGGGPAGEIFRGAGGRFGGAGASGDVDIAPTAAGDDVLAVAGADRGSSLGGGKGFDLDLGDADDLLVPILVIVMAAGMAAASLYVIWTAPTLLADLLFDSAISYGLYRRLRAGEQADWLATALRRTALPFALTALLLVGVGWGLHQLVPGARTVAEALHPARIPSERLTIGRVPVDATPPASAASR